MTFIQFIGLFRIICQLLCMHSVKFIQQFRLLGCWDIQFPDRPGRVVYAKCPLCDKVLSSKYKIKVHIKRVHQGEKPFKCFKCNKLFSQKHHMRDHEIRSEKRGYCLPYNWSLKSSTFTEVSVLSFTTTTAYIAFCSYIANHPIDVQDWRKMQKLLGLSGDIFWARPLSSDDRQCSFRSHGSTSH